MSAELAQREAGAPQRSLWQLWAIAAVSIAPLVFAFLAYQWWRPAASVSHGTLLATRPLPDMPLRLVDGGAFRLSQVRGKWVLLMADAAACDDYCTRKLYVLRQSRLAQGEDMGRIERVWLMTDEATVPARTLSAYEGTWFVRAAGSALLGQLPFQTMLAEHIYIIDPLGNIVLRYGRDADPVGIIKDISRLLKASRIE